MKGVVGVSKQGQPDEEQRGNGEDLSVPMWVWTLLGFALLTAVVIVVIIWGGGRQAEPESEMEPTTETVIEEPATEPTTTNAVTP